MPDNKDARNSPLTDDSSGRPFLKMHGLRNHFIVVDARETPYRPPAAAIVQLCDPQAGIGADQLVVIEPTGGRAAAFVRFWNVDGREVEACGNATRCVAWLLLEELGANIVILETRAGLLDCRRIAPLRVSTVMGRIRTGWRDIPLASERDTLHLDVEEGPLRDAVALNIGNPHIVFFVDDLDAVDLGTLAPPIQNNPLFPQQVNVGAAQMMAEDRMRLRVYERGAGLTMACGSGACVAHFAALSRGLTDSRRMTVELPGGELDIEVLADGSAVMTGPVAISFSGRLPDAGVADTRS
ncbi:MAG TPA: diaminopimelate epimerase [Woeseiaceae bacterium]|nr:diaminopimelate epimerase [Woeseiaceae bacterium]